jgi:protein involved in polysaccharide export with SLBB domain
MTAGLLMACHFTAFGADATEATDVEVPARLRQPGVEQNQGQGQNTSPTRRRSDATGSLGTDHADRRSTSKPPRQPDEFERYVSALAKQDIRRLGYSLMHPADNQTDLEAARQIPADYLIGVGDELQITIWGALDADLRATVDRAGRIAIPRVGTVMVVGVRYADLNDVLWRRIAQVFKGFQVTASLARVRNMRIYVTGFAARPGALSVSSLSTVMSALTQAGGPSSAGSLRNIELRRAGKPAMPFDLYALLLKGDRSIDVALQPDDVLHIGPIGPQVAVIGSVNSPSIVELRSRESLIDVLELVGGFNAVADRARVAQEKLSDRMDRRIREIKLPEGLRQPVDDGDVLQAFSAISSTLPQHKQFKRVKIEGEVAKPGEYLLPPDATLTDAISMAGGLTSDAFLFGTEFQRESVRRTQQDNYDRALRDLEAEFARNSLTPTSTSSSTDSLQASRDTSVSRFLATLKAAKPTGRVVMELTPQSKTLPLLVVEDGDRLLVPAQPRTVGVFGSVFNAGSYLWKQEATLADMLKSAGGMKRGADSGGTFVVRANGSVISARQTRSGWFSVGEAGIMDVAALPGDTLFVPEELNRTTFAQEAKDWTQILYQLGLGAAALKTLKN